MPLSAYATPTSELMDVNRILVLGGLPPVPDLVSALNESDAGLARDLYRMSLVEVASRGWWFNYKRDLWVEPSVAPGPITISNAFSAVTSSPKYPHWQDAPRVRLEVAPGSATGTLRDLDDNTTDFEEGLFVDVVYGIDPNNLPQEFRTYCVYHAASVFTPIMGVPFNERLLDEAYHRLDRAQSANMDVPNVLVENPETLLTWIR